MYRWMEHYTSSTVTCPRSTRTSHCRSKARIDERRSEPARQQTPARRGEGAVDDREQRPALPPVGPAEQLEVLHRAGIDEEVVRGLVDGDADHVLRRGALRLLQVRQRLRRRLDAERIPQAEPVQGGDAEMSLEQLLRALRIAERTHLELFHRTVKDIRSMGRATQVAAVPAMTSAKWPGASRYGATATGPACSASSRVTAS